jgi:hypothetical protein
MNYEKWNFILLRLLIASIVIFLIIILSNVAFSPKRVLGYSLGSSDENDYPMIRVDIENAQDDKIPLINTTYEEAIQMVERLNKTVSK